MIPPQSHSTTVGNSHHSSLPLQSSTNILLSSTIQPNFPAVSAEEEICSSPQPASQHPGLDSNERDLSSALSNAPFSSLGLSSNTVSSMPPSAGSVLENQANTTMANTKEKTPMCLINELARFNKVQHQYRLIDETGPAHKKTFTVVLQLDKEEFTASGPSIKKAQHKAANIALEQTKFKHPVPKMQHKTLGPMTPTVELNALAMKRGELAVYQSIDAPRPYACIPNFNFRGMYNQRYHHPRMPPVFCVALKVGNRQFFGEGKTMQAARHGAAEEALRVLRNAAVPETVKKQIESVKSQQQIMQTPPTLTKHTFKEEKESNGNETPCNLEHENRSSDSEDSDGDVKSPISMVHEIALKHNLMVKFEVIGESGPPHMRNFITRCFVGESATEGEGNSKKVSKKMAADKMLEELKKLPLLPTLPPKVKKKPIIKRKSQNLIKVGNVEQKADPQYGQGINPISRLIQIQQAKKDRDPVYSVVAERGEPRQREFIMQCALGELVSVGSGSKKKTAKQNAAETMLQLMGYSRPSATQLGKTVKTSSTDETLFIASESEKPRKVTFMEHDNKPDKCDNDGKIGRQLVPGLLLMPDANLIGLNRAPGGPIQSQDVSKITIQTTSTIAKELLDNGVSPTAEAFRRSGQKPPGTTQSSVRPKQQLLYLADILGFQVHFTDFPKGNKLDYLSLVSLSTSPPQVSHGAGPTIDSSHDQAALTALKALAELGLDSVTDKDKNKDTASGILSNGVPMVCSPKLANSSGKPDLGGNLNLGASVTTKDGL